MAIWTYSEVFVVTACGGSSQGAAVFPDRSMAYAFAFLLMSDAGTDVKVEAAFLAIPPGGIAEGKDPPEHLAGFAPAAGAKA